ncbi:YiiX family permuted papain-like enzyme [Aureivirga sp. CE67]|uniref:YiiX family permuted papain-like enzyme n=1 Tax=Aureivirga sp. CE67 TaxID=1788983 RepID=UPI0018CAB76E|nr:YiiX family permuted papain-like enzyme [Aureivirga sp. CE67]
MLKKSIITVILIGILSFLIYQGIQMYSFAQGVVEDAQKREKTNLQNNIQDGDIIFHTSKSEQSKAIQLATNSKYSHVGIIFKNNNHFFVYEAVQPVKITPLQEWINRGVNKHYVIKRLLSFKNPLNEENLLKLKNSGKKYLGKPYDSYFEWSDERIYCSELVWKMYKDALGIEIGKLEKLSDFDLNNPIVKKKLKERYGNKIPMNEKVISPASIFNSNLLVTIIEK